MFKLMGAYTFNKSLINFNGLKFIKLLGTGSKDGFSIIPDFSSYVMITSWESDDFRKKFIDKNELFQEIINKLDLFEGENYSRFKAQAFRLSDELKVEVELYMPNKKLDYCEPWIFENWLKLEKESFFMKDFNKDGIKKPIY